MDTSPWQDEFLMADRENRQTGVFSGELLAPFVEQLKGVCPLSSAVALMYKLVSGGR